MSDHQNLFSNRCPDKVCKASIAKSKKELKRIYINLKSKSPNKDHNLHFNDAIMLDILMQRKSLGTPFIDNFSLLLEDEFNKINVYENVASTLMKIGGRVGNLMDIAENAMSPDSQMGKEISNQEKDHIFKAINEIEEKIAKLKLSVK